MTAHLVDVTTRRPLPRLLRRRKAWFMVALALLLLAGVIVIHSPLLSLRRIEVAGADRVDVGGYLEREGIGPGAIMLWLDTGRVAGAVASDPWVESVRVERYWPNRLSIEVTERVPVLWVEGSGRWMLVAGDGTIVATADRPGEGLLRVMAGLEPSGVGTRPSGPVWAEITALGRVLPGPLAASSRLVAVGGEFWLETPEHRVRLGHPVDLADKGIVLQVMLADGLPAGSWLDVVAPRRPAVIPFPGGDLLQAQLEAYLPADIGPPLEGEAGDG